MSQAGQSWQLATLIGVLRLLVKPQIARTATPDHAKESLRRAALLARHPPFVRFLDRGSRGCWISAGPCVPRRVILYFHGGGFVAGGPWEYRAMLAVFSKTAGVEVCAPEYPLLQDAPFPAAFDAAKQAWAQLGELGYAPHHIILAGDSAGGNLALALLGHLCRKGSPPAASVLFSPWVDLTCSSASLQRNARVDPLLPPARIGELVDLYLDGADPRDPRASPLHGEFPVPPPIWMSYAQTEILHDEIAAMAARLRGFGARVTEERHPSAPHVWPVFQGWVPEGRATLRRAGRFIQSILADSNR